MSSISSDLFKSRSNMRKILTEACDIYEKEIIFLQKENYELKENIDIIKHERNCEITKNNDLEKQIKEKK